MSFPSFAFNNEEIFGLSSIAAFLFLLCCIIYYTTAQRYRTLNDPERAPVSKPDATTKKRRRLSDAAAAAEREASSCEPSEERHLNKACSVEKLRADETAVSEAECSKAKAKAGRLFFENVSRKGYSTGSLQELGFDIENELTNATHFITAGLEMTVAVVEAISLGKKVVSAQWLDDCLEAKHAIDENEYFPEQWQSAKSAINDKLIFQGRKFFATPSVKQDVEKILTAAVGGELMDTLEESNDICVISCEKDCDSYVERGRAMFSIDLLFVALLNNRFQTQGHEIICQVDERASKPLECAVCGGSEGLLGTSVDVERTNRNISLTSGFKLLHNKCDEQRHFFPVTVKHAEYSQSMADFWRSIGKFHGSKINNLLNDISATVVRYAENDFHFKSGDQTSNSLLLFTKLDAAAYLLQHDPQQKSAKEASVAKYLRRRDDPGPQEFEETLVHTLVLASYKRENWSIDKHLFASKLSENSHDAAFRFFGIVHKLHELRHERLAGVEDSVCSTELLNWREQYQTRETIAQALGVSWSGQQVNKRARTNDEFDDLRIAFGKRLRQVEDETGEKLIEADDDEDVKSFSMQIFRRHNSQERPYQCDLHGQLKQTVNPYIRGTLGRYIKDKSRSRPKRVVFITGNGAVVKPAVKNYLDSKRLNFGDGVTHRGNVNKGEVVCEPRSDLAAGDFTPRKPAWSL